ncbi:hypothetical protein EPN18_02510 [bacterium]|nr:MAG: hypothetical protein EPN18_02510 [bacterium]
MKRYGAVVLVMLLFLALGAPVRTSSAEDRLDRIELELKEIKKENEGLKKRLEDIEVDQEDTKQGYSTISKLVDVSGYADAELNFTNQTGEVSRFRIRHLSLFFSKDIEKEWKFFSEIEYQDAPLIEANPKTDTVNRAQGLIFVEQMYIQYRPVIDLDLRFGRFLTPVGIWSFYRYPPYVPTQTYPLFYKVVFPEVSDGIQLRKSFAAFKSIIDTHLYVSNGAGTPGYGDRNEGKALGGRVNYATDLVRGLEFGGSFFGERDHTSTLRHSYGAHLLLTRSIFKFQNEFTARHNHPVNGTGDFYDMGFYSQLSGEFGKWVLAGRYDWYTKDDRGSDTDHWRYTGAVNYHFAYSVLGKMEFNRNMYNSPNIRDYDELIFSIVVAIGDL